MEEFISRDIETYQSMMYVVLLGRPADQSAAKWFDFLNGVEGGIEIALEGIQLSQEFNDRFDNLTNEETVHLYFQTLFNRDASSSELSKILPLLQGSDFGAFELGRELFYELSYLLLPEGGNNGDPNISILGAVFDHAVFLQKASAARDFTNGITSERLNNAYSGDTGVEAGMNFLNTVSFTSGALAVYSDIPKILNALADLKFGPVQTAHFPFKDGNAEGYSYTDGSSDLPPEDGVLPIGFYLDQHVDAL